LDPIRLLYPLRTYLIVSGTLENPNVMTADWVCPLSFNPPMVGVAISKKRYTYNLVSKFKEFVISVPSMDLLDDVWKAGTVSGKNVDKKKLLSFTFFKSKRVSVPSIKECVANLECKVVNEIEIGDHVWFVGKIVASNFDKKTFKNAIPKGEFILHLAFNNFTTNKKEIKSL